MPLVAGRRPGLCNLHGGAPTVNRIRKTGAARAPRAAGRTDALPGRRASSPDGRAALPLGLLAVGANLDLGEASSKAPPIAAATLAQ